LNAPREATPIKALAPDKAPKELFQKGFLHY
jgi:hypothetical protein